MSDKTLATTATQEVAKPAAFSFDVDVQRVIAIRRAVEEIIEKVLVEGEHYGVIPGTSQPDKKPKKALLQPGAEVLCQVFRFRPKYVVETKEERPDFILREYRCELYNVVTGELVGEAIGSANSREEKYLVQTAARLCPVCNKPTIIKGKDEFGGGWLCFAKKGGCGAKFVDEDKKILDQTGAVSSDKVQNLHNTIISIAQKRAFVKATRTATATSNIFTDEPDDVHGDDKDAGGKGSGQPQSGKPATSIKADATKIRDLNFALRDAGIGLAGTENMAKGERDPAILKNRLEWINARLEEAGQTKVSSLMDLTPDQADMLMGEVKKGGK